MIIVGIVPYLVVMLIFPAAVVHREIDVLSTLVALTGLMVGGILGIAGILMAWRPETLRNRPKAMRRAVLCASAGVCGETVYFILTGARDLAFDNLTLFTLWMFLGPVIVGLHIIWRVIASFAVPTSERAPSAGATQREPYV